MQLNFRTGYIDGNGAEVLDAWPCCKAYLKTWFAVDLATCINLEWFMPDVLP
jgi:hypothetical protein